LSPTDCEHVLRQIELYLDGELVGQIRLEVERHLGDCHPCSGHADFQRHMKEMLRSKCGCDHVPEELAERIHTMFGEAPPVRG
jgi:mycothiol system anti-sigma-R factor